VTLRKEKNEKNIINLKNKYETKAILPSLSHGWMLLFLLPAIIAKVLRVIRIMVSMKSNPKYHMDTAEVLILFPF